MPTDLLDQPTETNSKPLVTYSITEAQIAEWRTKFAGTKIANIDDKASEKLVQSCITTLVGARSTIEKRRVELKADALAFGRQVDSEAKRLTALIDEVEAPLVAEKTRIKDERAKIEREKAEAHRAVIQTRWDALAAVGCHLPWAELEALTTDAYLNKVKDATESHRVAQERAAQEEAERQRKQAEEDARIKAENERLAAERAELERRQREQDEREAAARAELEAKQQAFAERQKRLSELQSIEFPADKITDDLLTLPYEDYANYFLDARLEYRKRKQAEEDERRAAEDERIRVETAARVQRETEDRLAREEEERQRVAAEEEAERKRLESLRPDKEKLIAFAEAIAAVPLPDVSQAAAEARRKVMVMVADASNKIKAIAEKL